MLITGTNQNVLALQCEQLKCRDVFGRSFPNSMDFTNEYNSHNSNNQDSCFQASGIGHVTQRLKPATKRPKPNVKQGLSALCRCPRSSPKSLSNPKKGSNLLPDQAGVQKKKTCELPLSLSMLGEKGDVLENCQNELKISGIRKLFIEMVQIPPVRKKNEHDNGNSQPFEDVSH